MPQYEEGRITDPPVWVSPTGREYPVEHHDYRMEYQGDEFESLTDLRAYLDEVAERPEVPQSTDAPQPGDLFQTGDPISI